MPGKEVKAGEGVEKGIIECVLPPVARPSAGARKSSAPRACPGPLRRRIAWASRPGQGRGAEKQHHADNRLKRKLNSVMETATIHFLDTRKDKTSLNNKEPPNLLTFRYDAKALPKRYSIITSEVGTGPNRNPRPFQVSSRPSVQCRVSGTRPLNSEAVVSALCVPPELTGANRDSPHTTSPLQMLRLQSTVIGVWQLGSVFSPTPVPARSRSCGLDTFVPGLKQTPW